MTKSDLVTITEEILDRKLHFLCSVLKIDDRKNLETAIYNISLCSHLETISSFGKPNLNFYKWYLNSCDFTKQIIKEGTFDWLWGNQSNLCKEGFFEIFYKIL